MPARFGSTAVPSSKLSTASIFVSANCWRATYVRSLTRPPAWSGRARMHAGTPRRLWATDAPDASWVLRRDGKETGRRYDHVFASARLNATRCAYLHHLRESGLSDHAAIEADF